MRAPARPRLPVPGPVEAAPAPADPGRAHGAVAEALVLQRSVGNRALVRQLARRQPYDEAVRMAKDVRRSRNLYSREGYLLKRLTDPAESDRDNQLAQFRAIELQIAKVGSRADQGEPGIDDPVVRARIAARRETLRLISWQKSAKDGLDWAERKMDGKLEREQIALVRRDMDSIKKEFKSTAYDNAYKLLDESAREIVRVLDSYGLTTAYAQSLAKQVAWHNKDLDVAVTEWLDRARGNAAVFNDKAKADKREALGQTARRLSDLRANVAKLRMDYFKRYRFEVAKAASGSGDPQRALQDQVKAAEAKANAAQVAAEIEHPLLTAYRNEDVDDLKGADTLAKSTAETAAMREVLSTTIQRLANIYFAKAALQQDKVTPLDLGPIVGITRAQMLIKTGTSWDGAVNDLIKAETKKDNFAIQVLQVVLSALSLIPGGQVFGLLAVGLDLYTAGTEYVQYGLDKTFAGTALDRAKALSDKTPSLAGFALALVGAGLNAVAARAAFKEAETLRLRALQGEQDAIDALNALGKEHGVANLADEATGGARATKGKRPATRTDEPPKTPRADEPPTTAKPKVKPASKPPPIPTRVTQAQKLSGEVAKTLEAAGPAQWSMRFADLPPDYKLLLDLLAENAWAPGIAKLHQSVDVVMASLRNPKLYGEVLGEAALRAAAKDTDITTELLAMARESGMEVVEIKATLDPEFFFREIVTKRKAIRDLGFATKDHGAMTHLIQDLVVDRGLKEAIRQGRSVAKSSGDFRTMLGRYTQKVRFPERLVDQANPPMKEMTLGEATWRSTYDLFQLEFAPTPEFVMPLLRKAVGKLIKKEKVPFQ